MTTAFFDQPALLDTLEHLTNAELDQLSFGVIGMDANGIVRRYNSVELKMANLSRDNVLNQHLFTHVAPCMNNFMVAQRFEDVTASGEDLDVTIDYVLTLRMRPKRVKLRLLARGRQTLRYVIVQPI